MFTPARLAVGLEPLSVPAWQIRRALAPIRLGRKIGSPADPARAGSLGRQNCDRKLPDRGRKIKPCRTRLNTRYLLPKYKMRMSNDRMAKTHFPFHWSFEIRHSTLNQLPLFPFAQAVTFSPAFLSLAKFSAKHHAVLRENRQRIGEARKLLTRTRLLIFMDTRLLRVFSAVAESGRLVIAARKVHLTPD